MAKATKEPMLRMSKRESIKRKDAYLIRAISLVLGLITAGIVVWAITKVNPIAVYTTMIDGNFGTEKRIWFMLRDTMVLACIAVGIGVAFKMRFWNIGAEGQMLVGALATAFFMIKYGDKIPTVLLFACMIIGSLIAGAIWGIIPGFFKAKWNANETLFTLMMNYIGIQLVSYAVAKWENPPGSGVVGTINSKSKAGWIGNMFSEGYNRDFMWTVIIVIAVTIIVYAYMKYTKQGYEIAVIGDSETTALYSGMRVPRLYVRTMAISGALCGFAGFLAVSAASHTVSTTTAGGRGFTAIIVAWLAKMNPIVMILVSGLLTFLDKGAVQIASDLGLNDYMSEIITGILLFFILGSEFFINYEVRFRKK